MNHESARLAEDGESRRGIKKIMEITPNAPAEPGILDSSLHGYLPAEEIDSVIEVNAGWTAKNKVKVGIAWRLTKSANFAKLFGYSKLYI